MPGTWAGTDWEIEIADGSVSIKGRAYSITLFGERAATVSLGRSWFRWFAYVDGTRALRLGGLRRAAVDALRIELRRVTLSDEIAAAVAWDRAVQGASSTASRQQRWIPRERVDALVELQPRADLPEIVRDAEVEPLLSVEERRAVSAVRLDLWTTFAELNEQTLRAELRDRRDFFDKIEKSPLTDEQARAVVCFDSRVHLLAAAGSGKTSVMVARAAYAVARGFVRPERVLLLAFNRAAAEELQKRVEERFAAAGIPAEGVRASTFHAFGLEVIGRATRRKPRLAPWLDSGEDTKMVERIVDALRDADRTFRFTWDLFRLMFASAPTRLEGGTPDAYDGAKRRSGYRTFRGEVVKSAGERLIANWLFVQGVDYVYERPYSVDVADATHSQYLPDFYYPDVDVWHEHWGIDANGKPRADFADYAEGMAWKKELHAEHQTKLVESTWYDVMYGDGLQRLQADLAEHGVKFDWNPDREIQGDVTPPQFAELVRLVRTFMTHVKSNSLDEEAIEARLSGDRRELRGVRTRLFLDLYWAIHREWDRQLGAQNYVDFEDMLVLAADHLEAGNVDPGYELILVDEFQDVSQARARLVRGLLQHPGRFLMAVGDDWQAINRFAGADISVMTKFDEWFGASTQLALETTFRCPQSICDVGSRFVMRNPRQFQKSVRSAQADPGPPVVLIRVDDVKAGVARALDELSRSAARATAEFGRSAKATVNLLGRYSFDSEAMPDDVPSNLDVAFRTVHGSKGLEADYIVIPRLVSGRYAFPSEIADDPVLDLAMAEPDDFHNAEERRLFYVALTRARRQVILVTQRGKESTFVVELLRDKLVLPIDGGGGEPELLARVCEGCGEGMMVRRVGPYGEFLGCSRFPACTHKDALPAPAPAPKPSPRESGRDRVAEGAPGTAAGVADEKPDCRFCANARRAGAELCRHCGRKLSGPEERTLAAVQSVATSERPGQGDDGAVGRVDRRGRAPSRRRVRWVLWCLLGAFAMASLARLYSRAPDTLDPVARVLESRISPHRERAIAPHAPPMFVNTAVLNVREAPGTDAPVVTQLRAGQQVRQVGQSGQWRQIALGDASKAIGWVYGPLLSASKPETSGASRR